MFIFLLYFLLNMKLCFSTVIIQNAGVYEINSDDIAMIFYLTVENTFECKVHVTVCSLKCIEGDPYSETADHMYVIGGDMGIINGKGVKNATLIYPNLYLRNRVGKCLMSVNYQTEQTSEQIIKEIYFNTNEIYKKGGGSSFDKCSTCDLTAESCLPVDCVIKYSSRRSYFNRERKICQSVPECPPNTIYVPKSNICRKLHEPVCESDLEMIEDGYIERCHSISNIVNYKCYHGTMDNGTGECVCDDGWVTATCAEGAYHPTLNLYHMCNVEFNSWQRANREKLVMTILVLVILAIALAAKMLLAVCLLNWCCHFIRSKSKSYLNDEFCGSEQCHYSYCGDEECLVEVPNDKSSRTIRVSFSNISSAEDTDATADDDKTHSENTSHATINLCRCAR
ncbi:uncharacterized protein LOC123005699 [Tribolium madens]|uniref:uncharacterized protein LOC123005699 n=1 Tax=Tribolium madens TaxID=41895 RepID=UPI001CF744C5|nr:uncharacterized protein LOC123005699 [Tribolium madens]